MKAIGKLEAKKGVTLYDAPMPKPGPNDLLIQIRKTAICGTDINIYEWKEWAQKNVPVPITIGHEFMGVVVEVGSLVKGFKVGDRVSGDCHLVCGVCRNCREGNRHLCNHTRGFGYHCTGCFAEYFCMTADNAFLVPDEIPDEVAASFDPIGCAVHTALSFDLAGEDVLITGAGPIGCIAVAVAKHAGARHVVITDVVPYRLELARQFPASKAVHPSDIKNAMQELGMTEGFGVGLEMSGNPDALNDMIDAMNHGGKIGLLGILPAHAGVDWIKVVFKSLLLKGIYGRKMYETWFKMVRMLQSGLPIKPIITHVVPYDQYEEAFAIMREGKCGKVVLDWAPPKKHLSDIAAHLAQPLHGGLKSAR